MIAILKLIVGLPSFIIGLTQFFGELNTLLKTLKATPEEHHEKIMDAVQKEADKFAQTGRPTE